MALTIDKDKLLELKEKIKAEMARRNCSYGSLSEYAGTDYDFTNEPELDELVYADFGSKTINLALKINDVYIDEEKAITFSNVNQTGDYCDVDFIEKIGEALSSWESEETTSATTSCRGQCTGLCAGSCFSTCVSGCTGTGSGKSGNNNACGSCTGNCSYACLYDCGTNCKNSCA